MKQEEFKVSIEKFESDVRQAKEAIFRELEEHFDLYCTAFRRPSDQNFHFRSFFNLRLRNLYEYSEPDDKNPANSKVYLNTITRSLCEAFIRVCTMLTEDNLPKFFDSSVTMPPGYMTCHQIVAVHRQELARNQHTTSDYADSHLLTNFNIGEFYPVLVRSYCLEIMKQEIESLAIDDSDFISQALKTLTVKNLSETAKALEGLSNKFNAASVQELVDFFSILKFRIRGYAEPIITEEDFESLVNSICSNEIAKDKINLNVPDYRLAQIRRLFYDFYATFRTRDLEAYLSTPLKKKDYLKFIENFRQFQGYSSSVSWVKKTTPDNQRNSLEKYVVKK